MHEFGGVAVVREVKPWRAVSVGHCEPSTRGGPVGGIPTCSYGAIRDSECATFESALAEHASIAANTRFVLELSTLTT